MALFVIMLLIVSIVFFIAFLNDLKVVFKLRHTFGWPKSTGVVRKSLITEQKTKNEVRYEVEVAWTFKANEKTYIGNNAMLSGREYFNFFFTADRKIKKYPVHKEIAVYYNPDNPQESVAERKFPLVRMLCNLILFLWWLSLSSVGYSGLRDQAHWDSRQQEQLKYPAKGDFGNLH